MSHSWLFSNNNLKIAILFFSLFNLIFLSSGVEIGVSPPELSLKGDVSEIICGKLSFFYSGETIILKINSFWAESSMKSRDIRDYQKNSSYYNLEFISSESFSIAKDLSFPICIKAKEEGFYSGLIVLSVENKNVGVGTWLSLNITEKMDKRSSSLITGNAILDKLGNNKPLSLFLVSIIAELLLLTYLVTKLLRKI